MKRAQNSKARKPRRAGRGALFVVAGLLFGSAMLRMGHDAGQAFARADGEIETVGLDSPPDIFQASQGTGMQELLDAFQKREERIHKQENAIKDRMQILKLADQEIERKLAKLVQAEEDLRATIALADTAAEGDIARLTKVYENMKPKQAAALFEEMNAQFAAGFLGRMRPEAAAGIMAGLSPEAAHSFSVVLAGRNAEVPIE